MIEPLGSKDRKIIASCIPMLEANGDPLARHFYKRMLCVDPEVKKFFNMERQKNGTQPRSLARAILLYAKNIEELHNLEPYLEAIIQKHVALDVQPQHYPIVMKNLLASLEEVLGPQFATPQVLNAWRNGLRQLSQILIGSEHEEYVHLYRTPGGWSGFRWFVVKERHIENEKTISLILAPEDRRMIMSGEPGQFLTLSSKFGEEEQRRMYSMSGPPSNDSYRITVKKIGKFSTFLHEVEVGHRIRVRPPLGEFVITDNILERGNDLVFVAGGIGITPFASFAHAGFRATLLYYAHSDEDRALKEELEELPNITMVSVTNRPKSEELRRVLTRQSHVYITGPSEFMRAVNRILKSFHVPESQKHFNFFGSTTDLG